MIIIKVKMGKVRFKKSEETLFRQWSANSFNVSELNHLNSTTTFLLSSSNSAFLFHLYLNIKNKYLRELNYILI